MKEAASLSGIFIRPRHSTAVYAPYASINDISSNVSLSNLPPLLHFSPGSSSVSQLFYVIFLNARIAGYIRYCTSTQGTCIIPESYDSGNWQLSNDMRNT